jgi:soluble lytic murein transglycosylase
VTGERTRARARWRRIAVSLSLLAALALASALGYRYWWLHRYDELIASVAPIYELDPRLVHAVIYEESFFRTHASSGAGARGLMQVTDPVLDEWRAEGGDQATRALLGRRERAERSSGDEALADPEINLHVGCWYLAKLLDRFGSEPEPFIVALAAYNAGPTHAERWLKAVPRSIRRPEARAAAFVDAIDYPETKAYVTAVRERYEKSLR